MDLVCTNFRVFVILIIPIIIHCETSVRAKDQRVVSVNLSVIFIIYLPQATTERTAMASDPTQENQEEAHETNMYGQSAYGSGDWSGAQAGSYRSQRQARLLPV